MKTLVPRPSPRRPATLVPPGHRRRLSPPAGRLLALQRAAGNRALQDCLLARHAAGPPAGALAGGQRESPSPEESEEIQGGEGSPFQSTLPYREATELSDCIRIMGDPAYCENQLFGTPIPSGPRLVKRTTVGPRDNGCGGFRWGTIFSIANATAATNGFVVQKLQFDLQRTNCDGTSNNFQKTYWEAWQVRGGVVFIGTSASRHDSDGVGDNFQVPSTAGRGVNREEGNAKFIPNYTAPLSWGRIPEAGSLPATTAEPAGWSEAGAFRRVIQSRFNCCGGKTETQFFSVG